MSIYPPNTTTPKSGNYVWNWLGSSLKKFAAALSPYMGGGESYKKYVALLSQTGIDPPVAIVLENTLGANLTYSRPNPGIYIITTDAIFPDGKTWASIDAPCYNGNGPAFFNIGRIDDTQVNMYCNGLGGYMDADTQGDYISIEIRVYP